MFTGVGIYPVGKCIVALDAIGVGRRDHQERSPYGMDKIVCPNGFQFAETGTPPMNRLTLFITVFHAHFA
jgi:hypothetical protein